MPTSDRPRKARSSCSTTSKGWTSSKAWRRKTARRHRSTAEPPGADRATTVGRANRLFATPLLRCGDDLGRRIDALRSTFERELRAEASRERIVDRLHAELQDYKQDLLAESSAADLHRPDSASRRRRQDDRGPGLCRPLGRGLRPAFRGLLESIQTAIEDILYRQGVEPFSLETGEFDPRRQRAISTAPTDDPALNKTVAARIRKGFAAGEKLIRPELVSVFLVASGPGPDSARLDGFQEFTWRSPPRDGVGPSSRRRSSRSPA